MKEQNKIRFFRYGLGILSLIGSIVSFSIIKIIPSIIENGIIQIFFIISLLFVAVIFLVSSAVLIGGCEAFIENQIKKELKK